MTRYKFRAECSHDVDKLNELMNTLNLNDINTIKNLPDCEVIIDTPLPIEDIKTIMNSIPDGHVMAQTLKPENEFDGERDYDGNDDDSIQICPNCLVAYENHTYSECPRCIPSAEGREDCPVIKAHCNYFSYQCASNGEIAISHCGHDDNQSDYEGNCIAALCPVIRTPTHVPDQILTALNILRANELDSVTLICDNPDFDGPNNIITVTGHWTNYTDKYFTGDTLLEALQNAVAARQRIES